MSRFQTHWEVLKKYTTSLSCNLCEWIKNKSPVIFELITVATMKISLPLVPFPLLSALF